MILTNKGTQFTDIQAAINSLPSAGGVIYLGPGNYTLPTTRITVKSNMVIKGSGVGVTTLTLPDAFGIPMVTTTGIIATISATPVNGGHGYNVNDTFNITTGGINGVGKVSSAGGGVVSSVALTVGGSGYTTGFPKATAKIIGSGDDTLTINIASITSTTIGFCPVYGEEGEFVFVNYSAGNNYTPYLTLDENISFEDMTIDGNSSADTQTRMVHGIGLQYVKNARIDNVEFINFGQFNSTPETINREGLGDLRSKGFIVKNCINSDINAKLDSTDGGAIMLTTGTRFNVISNNSTSNGLYLSDNIDTKGDAILENNEYTNLYIASEDTGGLGNLKNDISVISKTTKHLATYATWKSPGVYIKDAIDLNLHNSSISLSAGDGLTILNTITSHITDNSIYNNGQEVQGNGITMTNVDNSYINNNNIFDDQTGHTQYDAISSDGTSTGNTISNYKAGNTNSN